MKVNVATFDGLVTRKMIGGAVFRCDDTITSADNPPNTTRAMLHWVTDLGRAEIRRIEKGGF
jgi:hypothetical protein